MAISPSDILPLTEATTVQNTDLFYLVRDASTDRKLPASTLKGFVLEGYVGQSTIATVGTITQGTWQGTAIADGYIASASAWSAKEPGLGAPATNGSILASTASGTRSWVPPTDWSDVEITGGAIDGTAIGATTPASGKFTSVTADSLTLATPLQPSDLPNPLQVSLLLKTGNNAQFASLNLAERELGYNHESGELLIGQEGGNNPLALTQNLIPVNSVNGRPGYRLPAFVGLDSIWGPGADPVHEDFQLGANALDLQPFRSDLTSAATGKLSVAIGVSNRVEGVGATALGGYNWLAPGATTGVAIGAGNNNFAEGAMALGNTNIIGDQAAYSFALGTNCTVDVTSALALGNEAKPHAAGQVAIGLFQGLQESIFCLAGNTSSTTPVHLTNLLDEELSIPDDKVLNFIVEVTAVQSAPSMNVGQWSRRGVIIRRGGTLTMTNLHSIGTDLAPSGWSVALSVDTVAKTLKVTATGTSSAIRWTAVIRAVDLNFHSV